MAKPELPCTAACSRYVGRVSHPADLTAESASSGPTASTYVCRDPRHQAEAAEWVRATTGHAGVFVAFGAVAADA